MQFVHHLFECLSAGLWGFSPSLQHHSKSLGSFLGHDQFYVLYYMLDNAGALKKKKKVNFSFKITNITKDFSPLKVQCFNAVQIEQMQRAYKRTRYTEVYRAECSWHAVESLPVCVTSFPFQESRELV